MLLYDNKARIRILLQIYGSVYARILSATLFSAVYCVGLLYLFRSFPDQVPRIEHPYAPQSFATLIAFAVCFRVNIAWSRFWEACQEVTLMFSKWSDAYAQLQGFINSTIKFKQRTDPENTEIIERLNHARCEITHMFTVLSAVSVERLARGDIRRMEMRSKKGVPWKEQVVHRENLRAKDLTGSRNLIPFKIMTLKTPHKGFSLCSPKCNDEDTFDECQSCTASSESQERPKARRALMPSPSRLSVQLGQLKDNWSTPVSIVGDLSNNELRQLRDAKDRPGLILMWLGEMVSDLQPLLITPPPILSRAYQELSNGSLGFSQALKLSDVPFPFIFAQMQAVSVICMAAVAPVACTVITGDTWITPLLSAGVVLSFWALNEIAKELENPFGDEANNLPLYDTHERFAEYVIEVHGTCVPKDRAYELRHASDLSIYADKNKHFGAPDRSFFARTTSESGTSRSPSDGFRVEMSERSCEQSMDAADVHRSIRSSFTSCPEDILMANSESRGSQASIGSRVSARLLGADAKQSNKEPTSKTSSQQVCLPNRLAQVLPTTEPPDKPEEEERDNPVNLLS